MLDVFFFSSNVQSTEICCDTSLRNKKVTLFWLWRSYQHHSQLVTSTHFVERALNSYAKADRARRTSTNAYSTMRHDDFTFLCVFFSLSLSLSYSLTITHMTGNARLTRQANTLTRPRARGCWDNRVRSAE